MPRGIYDKLRPSHHAARNAVTLNPLQNCLRSYNFVTFGRDQGGPVSRAAGWNVPRLGHARQHGLQRWEIVLSKKTPKRRKKKKNKRSLSHTILEMPNEMLDGGQHQPTATAETVRARPKILREQVLRSSRLTSFEGRDRVSLSFIF